MSTIAIILVIISAFMHAGWNLFSKSRHPSASFFLVAALTGALMFSPALIIYRDIIAHRIPLKVWVLLFGSGFFLALYYSSLAGAYRSGDISVAYPLARSSPVIVVSIVALFLGRGDQISGICVAGIVLVVAGCFLIPLQRFGELRLKNYVNATCGLALLSAIGTSGYSILDDEALSLLRSDPDLVIGNIQLALLYIVLEILAAVFWLVLFLLIRRGGYGEFRRVFSERKKQAVLAGVIIYLTYLIVLISLAFVDNVSYVVGFRQISIPLGVTAGILIFKEKPCVPKLVGVAVMFIGLVLVALG